jgi:KUP system potassium uptake protein
MMEADDLEGVGGSIRQALIDETPPSPSTAPVTPSKVARAARGGVAWSHPAVVMLWSSVSCLGVVFGDLGTSPIYSFREAFARRTFAITDENVYGVLSMTIYALILVVTCKYLFLLCFVESKTGAGGTLALVGRLNDEFAPTGAMVRMVLIPTSMIAISLFLADSLITPGVSVLSAVEGLEALWPSMEPYSWVVAMAVLSVLFVSQRFGAGKLGGVFGPIMLGYFLVIGSLGLTSIALLGNWGVFKALNPFYSVYFMWTSPNGAWLALQSVILAITGAEALYADMGHFGRSPIQMAWHAVALPCLIFNYLGQGAVVLDPNLAPELRANPFFALAPTWYSRMLLVALSTCATLIGSQAVISGAFSVLEQAMNLDMIPRLKVVQTSKGHLGQVYIPSVNAFLGFGVIALVAIFRRSSNMASAYGLAVCGAMFCDSFLLFPVLRTLWRWPLALAVIPAAFFILLDSVFVSAAIAKIPTGGWIPLCLAGGTLFVLNTWMQGRAAVRQARLDEDKLLTIASLASVTRMKGTGVFFSRKNQRSVVPWCLDQLFQNLGCIHERNVLVAIHFHEEVDVCVTKDLGDGFFEVQLYIKTTSTDETDVSAVVSQHLPQLLAMQDTVFYMFREQPIQRHMSKVQVEAFNVMLAVGRGSFERILGPKIMDRTIEMVRRVPI